MDAGLVFGLIFAAIVIGLAFVFGSQQIALFLGYGSEAKVLSSVQDIGNMAARVYTYSKGSSDTYEPAIPAGTSICFVNPASPGKQSWPQPWKAWDPSDTVVRMISTKGYEGYGSNVWYYDGKSSMGSGKVVLNGNLLPRRQPAPGNFCVTAGNKLYFENRGAYVEVSTA